MVWEKVIDVLWAGVRGSRWLDGWMVGWLDGWMDGWMGNEDLDLDGYDEEMVRNSCTDRGFAETLM